MRNASEKVEGRDKVFRREPRSKSPWEVIKAFFHEPTGYGHKSMADHGITRLAAKLRVGAVLAAAVILAVILVVRAVV